jgi:hypothetical protein
MRRGYTGSGGPAVMKEIVVVTLEHTKKSPETDGLRGSRWFQGLLLDVTMHDVMLHWILREC